MVALRNLLNSYREAARTERDKGTYFERLAVAFLTHDPVQIQQYEAVQTYKDWAAANGWDGRDTGIDLVAKLSDEDGFAAIQCKFYDPDYVLQKVDIDSSSLPPARQGLRAASWSPPQTIGPSMPKTR